MSVEKLSEHVPSPRCSTIHLHKNPMTGEYFVVVDEIDHELLDLGPNPAKNMRSLAKLYTKAFEELANTLEEDPIDADDKTC